MILMTAACSAPPARPEARTSPAAPVHLTVEVVSGEPVAGARMALRARLDQQGTWPYPVAIEWQLPPGALMVGGSLATVVAASEPQTVQIDLARVPEEDVVVTASSRGPDAGFHAEARYRFGRPAPPPPAGPAKTGPQTEMNGHDLGPSVPMN